MIQYYSLELQIPCIRMLPRVFLVLVQKPPMEGILEPGSLSAAHSSAVPLSSSEANGISPEGVDTLSRFRCVYSCSGVANFPGPIVFADAVVIVVRFAVCID